MGRRGVCLGCRQRPPQGQTPSPTRQEPAVGSSGCAHAGVHVFQDFSLCWVQQARAARRGSGRDSYSLSL